jgi:hypothetical protein
MEMGTYRVDSVPKLRHLFERQLPADLKNPATLQEIWRFAFAYAKGKDDAKIIGTHTHTQHKHTPHTPHTLHITRFSLLLLLFA